MSSDSMEPNKPKWPDWYERWVFPFLDEPAIWPVFLAIWGHFVVALTGLVLSLYREQSPVVLIVGLWIVFACYKAMQFEKRHAGRYGKLTGAIVATWLCSFIVAWFVDYTGLY